MKMVADLIGLAGHCVLLALFVVTLMRRYRRSAQWLDNQPRRIVLLPFLLCGLAWFSRGLFSDISITGLVLGICWLRRQPPKLPIWLLAGWALIGLLLYTATLGYINADLYSSGFHPKGLLLLVLLWIVINGVVDATLGWTLTLALCLFAARAMNSINLWDYLIDPVIWLIFMGMLIRRAWNMRRTVHPVAKEQS